MRIHNDPKNPCGTCCCIATVFYDFTEADAEFLGKSSVQQRGKLAAAQDATTAEGMAVGGVGDEDDQQPGDSNAEDWEDVSDDEEEAKVEKMDVDKADKEDEDDDDFDEAVARMGFDVTPLGELVLPDGRIVRHLAFSITSNARRGVWQRRTIQLWQRHDWPPVNVCTADKSIALAMVTVLVMVVMRTNITNTRH